MEQLISGLEVVLDEADRYPGVLGDIPQSAAVKTPLRQTLCRRHENALPRLDGVPAID